MWLFITLFLSSLIGLIATIKIQGKAFYKAMAEQEQALKFYRARRTAIVTYPYIMK